MPRITTPSPSIAPDAPAMPRRGRGGRRNPAPPAAASPPRRADAAYHNAIALDRLGRARDAEVWLERAQKLDPRLAAAPLDAARSRRRRPRAPRARPRCGGVAGARAETRSAARRGALVRRLVARTAPRLAGG